MREIGITVINNAEAVELYKKVSGLELEFHVRFPNGEYQHTSLLKDSKEVFISMSANNIKKYYTSSVFI